MKMKTLSMLAGVGAPLIATASASAGFVGINTVIKENPFGYLVVNVYAEFDRPGQDEMQAVAGTANNPLIVQVQNGTFFNANGGTDKAPSAFFISLIPSLAFDTFVTIGIKFTEPLFDALIIAPDFQAGITGTQLFLTNSGWAVTPVDPQTDPFDPAYVQGNGTVLIGQFSTADGTAISGTFLLQFTSNGVPGVQSVVSFFAVPTPGALALLGAAGLIGARRRRRN